MPGWLSAVDHHSMYPKSEARVAMAARFNDETMLSTKNTTHSRLQSVSQSLARKDKAL